MTDHEHKEWLENAKARKGEKKRKAPVPKIAEEGKSRSPIRDQITYGYTTN